MSRLVTHEENARIAATSELYRRWWNLDIGERSGWSRYMFAKIVSNLDEWNDRRGFSLNGAVVPTYVCRAMIEIIESFGWTQSPFRDNGTGRVELHEAFDRAASDLALTDAESEAVYNAIIDKTKDGMIPWSNRIGRTKDEVIAMLKSV